MIGLLLLVCQGLGPDAAVEWARHGFAPDAVPARAEDDSLAAAGWDLAQLVPERVSGRAVDAAVRSAAIDRVLETVATLPDELRAVAYARLRGRLNSEQLAAVGAMLREERGGDRPQLFTLLQSAPIEAAEDTLIEFALDERQSAPERGVLAEHLLIARGRPALDRLRPAIRPDAAPQFLRRVYAGWRNLVIAEDLPLLEQLAREGKEYAAQFALQLWAMYETDPARRLAIFRLALNAGPNYRQVAWDALGRGGRHEGIVEDLLALLDAGNIDNRSLARRFLPVYGGPDALWLAYQERASGASLNLRAQWMTALAASPLREAREEAARWLSEHGRMSGDVAMAVARILGDDEVLDPMLRALLTQSELPDRILWPLALRRAATSEAARDNLRERIELDGGLVQQQSLEHLAPYASEADLAMIARIARGSEYSSATRAVALSALAEVGRAEDLLAEWLQAPPRGYEIAEGFVKAVVLHGTAEQLEEILGDLERGLGFPDPDEQRGIRIAAWEAAGKRGDLRSLQFLATELQRTLASVPMIEGGWPSLYDLSHELFELGAVIDATLECAGRRRPEEVAAALRSVRIEEVAPQALFFAAGRFAPFLPALADDWFRTLDLGSLSELDRMRAAAWWAWTVDPALPATVPYGLLLEDPTLYRRFSRPLAETFSPDGAGWTLFHDRIEERARLLSARGLTGTARRAHLAGLRDGRCEGAVLLAAAELLSAEEAPDPADLELAIQLARQATAAEPLSSHAHTLVGKLLDLAGDRSTGRASWEAVLRTTPKGSEAYRQAEERLLTQD